MCWWGNGCDNDCRASEIKELKMKIGVIGAGTMGAGIAQVFGMTLGYEVILCDVKKELAEKGREKIKNALEKLLKKGKIDGNQYETTLKNIQIGLIEDLSECELVIEAVLEKMEIKKELFKYLIKICSKDCIFASNTSSLSLTEMSQGLDRSVVGMHFFNPVPVMKLVEVIAGYNTGKETVEKIKTIAEEIGKVPVVVEEAAGFIVNRILIPLINEGIQVYSEGTASAEDIDTAMKLGANHPMGPLALGDLVGLDVVLAIMEVLYLETGSSKYAPAPLLKKMVRGGVLGVKTGRGFFKY